MKITPNNLARIKQALEVVGEKQAIEVRFKFAKIMKLCDEALELFRSTLKAPSTPELDNAMSLLDAEDLKGKQADKLKLVESINKKYSKELKALAEHNQAAAEASNTPLEVELGSITLGDLPQDVAVSYISVLTPIIEV